MQISLLPQVTLNAYLDAGIRQDVFTPKAYRHGHAISGENASSNFDRQLFIQLQLPKNPETLVQHCGR